MHEQKFKDLLTCEISLERRVLVLYPDFSACLGLYLKVYFYKNSKSSLVYGYVFILSRVYPTVQLTMHTIIYLHQMHTV